MQIRRFPLILAVLLLQPVAASAQDWVVDWTSTDNVVTQPFTSTDTSPQTRLIPQPIPPSLPPDFN